MKYGGDQYATLSFFCPCRHVSTCRFSFAQAERGERPSDVVHAKRIGVLNGRALRFRYPMIAANNYRPVSILDSAYSDGAASVHNATSQHYHLRLP
eukprot:scaffold45195_cov78-Cyclotella_meneghiniana.AAC.7